MEIYVVFRSSEWDTGFSLELVCSNPDYVVELAKKAEKEKYLDKLYCRVYDGSGKQINEGYLYKAAELGILEL